MNPDARSTPFVLESIDQAIYLVRGQRVMLDHELAGLYGVETGALTRAIRRNRERFPSDFAFVLTHKEFTNLKCQTGISSSHGGRRRPPYAFTEHGVAMLSSVLRSKRAIRVNVQIIRAFVKLRALASVHRDLTEKLLELEKRTDQHDQEIRAVFDAIRQLTAPPPKRKRKRIGFTRSESRP